MPKKSKDSKSKKLDKKTKDKTKDRRPDTPPYGEEEKEIRSIPADDRQPVFASTRANDKPSISHGGPSTSSGEPYKSGPRPSDRRRGNHWLGYFVNHWC